MKLLILSDLHLEFGAFRVPNVEFDVAILAGDIAVRTTKATDSAGVYATALWLIRRHEALSALADPQYDLVALESEVKAATRRGANTNA